MFSFSSDFEQVLVSIILSIISLKKMYFKTKILLDHDKFGFLTRVYTSQITNNCIYNNYITYTMILLYIMKSPLTPLNRFRRITILLIYPRYQ